jgi:RNA polymerase sigma-70 factor (ECF subfamily)
MEIDDGRLITEAIDGSQIAFELLMRRYERLVYRVAYFHTGEHYNSMDITQNVFLKVFKSLNSLTSYRAFQPWLVRITINEALNWRRSQRPDLHSDFEFSNLDLSEEASQEDLVRESENRMLIVESLAHLNPKQKLAITLRYFEGSSIDEIASVLDCTKGVAKNILFRGMSRLKEHFQKTIGISI